MRSWLLVLAVGCGAPKSTTPGPSNLADDSGLTAMDPEVIEVAPRPAEDLARDDNREQAIEQARAAGILGGAPGEPNAPLDKGSIRAAVQKHLSAIQLCYERQLLEQPGLTGTTMVEFTIDGAGAVSAASASGFQPTVDACVAAAIKQIAFPKPRGGKLGVKYPFTFKPA